MNQVQFSREEMAAIVEKVKRHFEDELNQDIGSFDAEFLVEFFSREIGAYFYNRGLYDAQAILASKTDELSESIYELEQPTDFSR